ncbi:GLPGLI family protein [Bizionia argentinensis JUB59]|uniref:GLPGLI family protein n=1 Tax=Bizionia argentinensis JUB59 TaxID=1046627 RepID=G2EEE7_9FLAO|nr:GLPGLI family protein [Bizionia argentinensis]EGV43097.1 GLPGLI family protein [Bizionia argentinensis JUB59]
MKKNIINIIILLLTVFSYSQNTKYFEAEYNIYYNTDIPQTRKAKLQIDKVNKQSIFIIGKTNESDSKSSVSATDNGLNYTIKYEDLDRFIEMDFGNLKIHSKETHRGKTYYVQDTISTLNWDLRYNDEKKIGSLLCKKATTDYRGRKYTAWYALEIPLAYGPYKFHGLPGLIASISDSSNTFIWTIVSYKLKSVKPDFKNDEKLKPLISAQKYYSEIRYPLGSEKESIFQSKLPKGIKLISATSDAHIRKGVEIKFEWEEEIRED